MIAPQKRPEEPISWALIVLLFGIGIWPIGLVLLFVKLFAPDRKKTADEVVGKQGKNGVNRVSRAARSVTRQPKMKPSNARLLQIIGGFLLFVALKC